MIKIYLKKTVHNATMMWSTNNKRSTISSIYHILPEFYHKNQQWKCEVNKTANKCTISQTLKKNP